jgi:hypothetical protein
MNKIPFLLLLATLIPFLSFSQTRIDVSTSGHYVVEVRDKDYYERIDKIAQEKFDLQWSYVMAGKEAFEKGDFETVWFYGIRIKLKSLWDYRFLYATVGAYKLGDMKHYKKFLKGAKREVKPETVRLIKKYTEDGEPEKQH